MQFHQKLYDRFSLTVKSSFNSLKSRVKLKNSHKILLL